MVTHCEGKFRRSDGEKDGASIQIMTFFPNGHAPRAYLNAHLYENEKSNSLSLSLNLQTVLPIFE